MYPQRAIQLCSRSNSDKGREYTQPHVKRAVLHSDAPLRATPAAAPCIQQVLAANCNGIWLACHHARVKRPETEGCQDVFNQTGVTHSVVQPDLVTLQQEILLIALGDSFFIV